MNAGEIDFAWHVYIDHVVAWTTTRAKVPDDSEAEGLAKRALETAALFSSVVDRPTRSPAIKTPVSLPAGSEIPLTFAQLARPWSSRIASQSPKQNDQRVVLRLERYVIPHLGDKAAKDITPQDIFAVLRIIEGKGFAFLAYMAFRDLRALYRYAVVAGIVPRDPTAVMGTYVRRPPAESYAALTDSMAIGQLLVLIGDQKGKSGSTIPHMFRLAPILFLRPVELKTLEWNDVDLDAATIVIPGLKMKSRQPHVVPLPRQAVKMLREVHAITGSNRYVFTGGRVDRPPGFSHFFRMLRAGGFHQSVTVHGFRSMAATWLSEQGWRGEVIERQLSHVGDAGTWGKRRVYNRGEYLQERRKMLQAWADHLEGLEQHARTIPRTRVVRKT